jgi:hypothetical protein
LKPLRERPVIIMHDKMEHPLRNEMFRTYQLKLPMIGCSQVNPEDTPEERDKMRLQLLQFAIDLLADPNQVEIMTFQKYLKVKAAEEGKVVGMPVGQQGAE